MSEQNSMSQAEEQGEVATTSNPIERVDNEGALAAEVETREALYDVIVEAEDVGDVRTE